MQLLGKLAAWNYKASSMTALLDGSAVVLKKGVLCKDL